MCPSGSANLLLLTKPINLIPHVEFTLNVRRNWVLSNCKNLFSSFPLPVTACWSQMIRVTNLAVFPRIYFCFSDCFFFKFYGKFSDSICSKRHVGVFWWNFVHFECAFRICYHPFLNNLLAEYSFCCNFLPTHVGLVLGLNYLFLACFSYYIACFCKITWHHCTWSSETRLRVKRRVSLSISVLYSRLRSVSAVLQSD